MNKPEQVRAPRLGEIGLENFAPYLMNRITRNYNEGMSEVMENAGLTVPKMRALSVLVAKGALPLGDLAVLAISEQSTMSRIVDQMERDGLVIRKKGPKDARERQVYLTELGLALRDPALNEASTQNEALMAGLTAAEQRQLISLASKLLMTLNVDSSLEER